MSRNCAHSTQWAKTVLDGIPEEVAADPCATTTQCSSADTRWAQTILDALPDNAEETTEERITAIEEKLETIADLPAYDPENATDFEGREQILAITNKLRGV